MGVSLCAWVWREGTGWLSVVHRMYPTLNWSRLSPRRIRYGDRGGDIEG